MLCVLVGSHTWLQPGRWYHAYTSLRTWKKSQIYFSWHGLIKYEVKVQQKHRKELRWNRLNTLRVLCAVNLCFPCSTQIHKMFRILMGRHAQYLQGCLALRRCHPLQPQRPLWSETGCYRNEMMCRKGKLQCSCPKQAQTSLTSCRRLLLARAWQVESSGGCDGLSRRTCRTTQTWPSSEKEKYYDIGAADITRYQMLSNTVCLPMSTYVFSVRRTYPISMNSFHTFSATFWARLRGIWGRPKQNRKKDPAGVLTPISNAFVLPKQKSVPLAPST